MQISSPVPSQPGRKTEAAGTKLHSMVPFCLSLPLCCCVVCYPQALNIYSSSRHGVAYTTALFTSHSEETRSAHVLQHRNAELAEGIRSTWHLVTSGFASRVPTALYSRHLNGRICTYNTALFKNNKQHSPHTIFYSSAWSQGTAKLLDLERSYSNSREL